MRMITIALCTSACAPASASFTFSDIELWAGEGENSAALVVDWNAGLEPVSLAWGYRWDGEATGADMLFAVMQADPNFYGRFASLGFGDIIVGLGYDLDADGFGISDGTDFGPGGIAFAGTSDGAVAADADDHYAEGWDAGFWSYWGGAGEPFGGGGWESLLVGFTDRVLTDGAWDGYRFAPGFVGEPPRAPVAVPGPAGAAVLGALLVSRRRRG